MNAPPAQYLIDCKQAAAARNRSLYLYWSPEDRDWRSTVHITMIPPDRSFMMVTPGGAVRPYGPA